MGQVWLWGVLLVGALLGIAPQAHGQQAFPYIRDYQVRLDVQADGRLLVTEALQVDFGPLRRHGIYRTVPFRYERPLPGGLSATYRLRVRLLSVTDSRGRPLPVRQRKGGGSVEWRVGDPEVYVQGQQSYVFRYEVRRGLLFFADHDELYWNCIGHDWDWVILQGRCTVVLPGNVDPGAVRTAFYTGRVGSQEARGRAAVQGSQVVFETGRLAAGEGLTVVVGWPKGVVQPPPAWQDLAWWVSDNWGVPVGLLFPLVVGGFLFLRWWREGRDPAGRPVLVPQYRPPAGLTPAEVGVLLDERADPVDVTATVVDLAVRGYLRIREETSQSLLVFRNVDYVFEFPEPPPGPDALKPHERTVYEGLRASGAVTGVPAERSRAPGREPPRTAVRLSSLRERFYLTVRDAQQALYRRMAADGYFAGNPQRIRDAYRKVGLLFVFGGFGAWAVWGESSPLNAVLVGLGVALGGVLFLVFGPAMPRRTAKGVHALWEILGFREFVRRVESDRLERLVQEQPDLFDRVLPYALVFGVADEWAQKFQGLLQKPPEWYQSDAWPDTFRPQVFLDRLSHAVSSMNSVLPSAPSRSSGFGAGRSGFSRGFSGGGGGGGGGGSW
ncbi:MAG: DUF2207 domain-containing protein [bacterium]